MEMSRGPPLGAVAPSIRGRRHITVALRGSLGAIFVGQLGI